MSTLAAIWDARVKDMGKVVCSSTSQRLTYDVTGDMKFSRCHFNWSMNQSINRWLNELIDCWLIGKSIDWSNNWSFNQLINQIVDYSQVSTCSRMVESLEFESVFHATKNGLTIPPLCYISTMLSEQTISFLLIGGDWSSLTYFKTPNQIYWGA